MAAALHLVEVARVAVIDPRFEIVVVAQEPAARQFSLAGIPVRTVALPAAKSATGENATRLCEAARQLLAEIRPDAVLAGLSTPFDAGLDEAVLAEARVPSFLYQDFWGEQNLLLGRGADHILAIDQQAAERNRTRYQRPSTIVGSARHAAYARLDIGATRARVRKAIAAPPSSPIIGFFGQALHQLDGYQRTVARFIEATNALDRSTILILRPHPREGDEQRRQTDEWFEAAQLKVTRLPPGPVEDALTACDAVVSLFSICTFDTAYLNRFSDRPVAVPMSLLFDDEITTYCRQHGNYLDFNHHTLGLVKPVYEAGDLLPALQDALQMDTRQQVWERAHRHLPSPSQAPERVLSQVIAATGATPA